jgi:hypothetical protein
MLSLTPCTHSTCALSKCSMCSEHMEHFYQIEHFWYAEDPGLTSGIHQSIVFCTCTLQTAFTWWTHLWSPMTHMHAVVTHLVFEEIILDVFGSWPATLGTN